MRPEWVTCVMQTPNYAMCGRYIGMEFVFVDWEHADLNAERQGRLVTCWDCVARRGSMTS